MLGEGQSRIILRILGTASTEPYMLDSIDRQILQEVTGNARITLKDLAGRVGLSSPSVSERLRRLEERQVIRSWGVDVDPLALGYPLQAIVRVRPLPGKTPVVQTRLAAWPEVGECDKVTGEDCFVARLHLRSMQHLEQLLAQIADVAETNSAIVKSQLVARRPPPLKVEGAAVKRPPA